MPVSRMEMEESSSCMLERRDDTQPSREFAMVSAMLEVELESRLGSEGCEVVVLVGVFGRNSW